MRLFVIALAWAIFGQIDIVAVAPGRIVVSDRTKTHAAAGGQRRQARAGEGRRPWCEAGQVLVELDATNASADGASVQRAARGGAVRGAARRGLAARRWAIERRQSRRSVRRRMPADGVADWPRETAQAQLQAEWRDITRQARQARRRSSARRQAEIATVRELIAKLEATLPIARQREADFKSLADAGLHVRPRRPGPHARAHRAWNATWPPSARAWPRRRRRCRGSGTRGPPISPRRRALLSERAAAAALEAAAADRRNAAKTEQRSRLTQLTAPVAGTVQQVAVHTEGGVVTPAQVLMVIVPEGRAT